MSKVYDMSVTREHSERSNFGQFLVETADECDGDDWHPAHWCLLGSGFSTNGGGVETTIIGDRDRTSLLTFIGMLESAKAEAIEALNKLDDEEY